MIYPFPQIIRRKQPIEKVCDKIKSFHNNHLNPTNQSFIQIFTAEVLIFLLHLLLFNEGLCQNIRDGSLMNQETFL